MKYLSIIFLGLVACAAVVYSEGVDTPGKNSNIIRKKNFFKLFD